jgi:hypothetical protein
MHTNRPPRLARRIPAGAALLILMLFLVGLSACGPQAGRPLPTLVAAAAPLDGPAGSGPVPSTWTPAALVTAALSSDPARPLLPTLTPTVTPPFPSRTPTRTPTATPTATETPYVYKSNIPDLPPTDELGPSKLGLHVIRNNDPAIMEFIRRAQPAVIKAVDDLGFLAEAKEVSPRTWTVGRISIPSQDYDGVPEEAAQRFVADNLATFLANPWVDYWEGWNEPDPNYDKMLWYSRFEQERVRQMARHGLRCAIGSFAAGVPEFDEFQLFLPAIDIAMQHGGVLSLHEYSAPEMTYLYGGALPGFPAYPDRGSLTFRYRWLYREILEPGDMVIPLIITEAGVDGIIGNRPGPPGTGWWDFQDYWVQQGWGSTGAEAFTRQLAWYDAGVRQDGYVIGFTVFTAGGFGYWKNYDINPILPQLADYVVGQR